MSNIDKAFESKVYGCWIGKSIGGTLGLPAEGKMERMNFTFYDPVPKVAPPNDDLELQLVWLDVIEKMPGSELTQEAFGTAWLRHIHYMWDEYGRCRWNLRRGVPARYAGVFENWFHAGMGSPIRSEIWACLFPGDAASAAYYAALDASLDHSTEGIAGEVFLAVMQSLVAVDKPLLEAVNTALAHIPASCETARAIQLVLEAHAGGVEAWATWKQILEAHRAENFTHAPMNVALTVWALLYGNGDFEASILLAVNGGYDTDCTGATAGATLGLMLGADKIPQRWREPIGDGIYVGPGIHGINAPKDVLELTQRTLKATGKLARKDWSAWSWEVPAMPESIRATLPGYIQLQPIGGGAAVAWSNGELPAEAKRAGGAEWDWEVTYGEARKVVCLARAGAKLFVDGKLVHECPKGLPFVPATHRCGGEAIVTLTPGAGKHRVRVELGSKDEAQDASVILAYPNLHIAPWTVAEVSELAQLPA